MLHLGNRHSLGASSFSTRRGLRGIVCRVAQLLGKALYVHACIRSGRKFRIGVQLSLLLSTSRTGHCFITELDGKRTIKAVRQRLSSAPSSLFGRGFQVEGVALG